MGKVTFGLGRPEPPSPFLHLCLLDCCIGSVYCFRCMYFCVHAHMCVRMYVFICVCVYVHLYVHV